MRTPLSVRISQENVLPLTVEEVATHLHIDEPAEGTPEYRHLIILMEAAIGAAQSHSQTQIIPALYQLTIRDWPGKEITFDRVPFIDVTGVKYYDEAGSEITVPADKYRSRKLGPRTGGIRFLWDKNPPLYKLNGALLDDSVVITYRVGCPERKDVPGGMIGGILSLIAYMYDNRTDSPDELQRVSETLFNNDSWIG